MSIHDIGSVRLYLNLGCGHRFHRDWTNVDLVATDQAVVAYDLRRGIPYSDQAFEAVYHSHLLEHLPKARALPFLRECYRVLKPGGVIRVGVPDLETIARTYLRALEEAWQGHEPWQNHYEWIMLELYDQTVRERSGGEMLAYLSREDVPDQEFVLARMGAEGKSIMDRRDGQRGSKIPKLYTSIVVAARCLYRFARRQNIFREGLVRLFLGPEYELLRLGRFRRGGEIHLWMYDRHSLKQLMGQAGFQNPRCVGAAESDIPGWAGFHLDAAPDGTAYKPDSLYMEAERK